MNAKKRLFLRGGGITKCYIAHCGSGSDSAQGSE